METFPDYIYDQPSGENILPMVVDGKWVYEGGRGRQLDRAKFEDFKTRFYKFEGYNPDNGFPTEDEHAESRGNAEKEQQAGLAITEQTARIINALCGLF